MAEKKKGTAKEAAPTKKPAVIAKSVTKKSKAKTTTAKKVAAAKKAIKPTKAAKLPVKKVAKKEKPVEGVKKAKGAARAIVRFSGHQYKVSEGLELTLDRVDQVEGKSFEFGEVLLTIDGEKVEIGQPVVEKAKVTARVVEHKRDKKIKILRFEAKSRSRRRKGHKQPISIVKIEKVSI